MAKIKSWRRGDRTGEHEMVANVQLLSVGLLGLCHVAGAC